MNTGSLIYGENLIGNCYLMSCSLNDTSLFLANLIIFTSFALACAKNINININNILNSVLPFTEYLVDSLGAFSWCVSYETSGILYKADPDPDSELQKKRTLDV